MRPPATTAELREELLALAAEIERRLEDLSTDEFLAPQGDYWSPAEHVRHLVTSVGALSRGMSLPRWLLALRFGISRRPSRSYDEVRGTYRAALAAGGRAAGRWDPSRRKIDLPPEEQRSLVMARWRKASEELVSAIDAWPEPAFDRYRAKHPLLGMMTARELLFFTLYHNAHHARRIQERRGRSSRAE